MKSQTFGEKIHELRKGLGYSLKQVAQEVGCSPRLLSKIETNQKKAPEHLVKSLSQTLQVSHDELIIKYLSEEVYYRLRSFEQAEDVLAIVESRIKREGKGTQLRKSRRVIIEAIKNYFSDKPVEKAWVFGSFARGGSFSMDSDIDIMVQFKKPNKVSLFDIVQMKEELSKRTGRAIDLIEQGQELKSYADAIQREKLLVYGS